VLLVDTNLPEAVSAVLVENTAQAFSWLILDHYRRVVPDTAASLPDALTKLVVLVPHKLGIE
jgi:hypothetical protein